MNTTPETKKPKSSPSQTKAVAVYRDSKDSGILANFDLAQRAATALSKAGLVPAAYQNNIPNCLIAIDMAERIGASPMQVMQNLDVINGKPSWSAKFLIATFNRSPDFGRLHYDFQGEEGTDAWGCRASAVEISTKDKLVGPLITIGMAKEEGWYGKKGSKWQTIPEQMLRYRAAAWFINTTAPECSMGLNTSDELHDVEYGLLDEDAPKLTAGDVKRQAGIEDEVEDADFEDEIEEEVPDETDASEAGDTPQLISGELIAAMSDSATVADLDELWASNEANIASYTEKAQSAVKRFYDEQRKKLN